MQAYVLEAPATSREAAELNPGVPRVPEAAVMLREALAEAVVRAIWLRDMTAGDVSRLVSSIRSCELANLRSGDITKFGANRLANLASSTGCSVRIEVIPPAVPERAPDARTSALFTKLDEADRACQEALEHVGPRSYPLAAVAVRQAGTACALAVEAIRRNPWFWHREAESFSSMLLSAEQLLERVKYKHTDVSKALSRLRQAAELMEDLADRIRAERGEDSAVSQDE